MTVRIGLLAVVVLAVTAGSPRLEPARAGAEAMPDLAMAPLSEFQIQWVNGRRLLRFTAMMVNIGPGHLEVRGSRASTSAPMTVDQVIYQSVANPPWNAAISRRTATDAVARYAGDGHNHWHVQEMMRYDLWGGPGTYRGAKVGFCFLDSDVNNAGLPGYSGGHYTGPMCSTNPSALSNRMGISIGMGDEYEWYLAWQWVDITGLPSGTYTVRANVDPGGWFEEQNETNQCAYAVVSFTTSSNGVTVHQNDRACVNDWSSSIFAASITWMFESGITSGCAPDLFCTNNSITRGEMAAFLDRALNLPSTTTDFFTDDNASIFETSIDRVAAAGITGGCGPGRYCPGGTVTREQMAAFIDRAFDLPQTAIDHFVDDETSIFEGSINRLASAGIASGCTTTRFCPTEPVTRGQMAAFLDRAIND